MTIKRIFTLVILAIVVVISWISRQHQQQKFAGPYFGETVPGKQPQLFSPNWVSNGLNNRDVAFSADTLEFYTTVWMQNKGILVFSEQESDHWSDLQIAAFSGTFSDLEPFFTPQGDALYFASNRPLSPTDSTSDYNIWIVKRKGDAWSEPQPLDDTINTPANEFYPSLTKEGTLYWTAAYPKALGGEDIWRAQQIDGVFQERENLGPAINSAGEEFNAFISPDEDYLIFSAWGRDDDLGGSDLYIAFLQDGAWSKAVNMGETINSDKLDYCPFVSADGDYMFFTSKRTGNAAHLIKNYQDLRTLHNSPGNGSDDIYWVDAAVIQDLRALVE